MLHFVILYTHFLETSFMRFVRVGFFILKISLTSQDECIFSQIVLHQTRSPIHNALTQLQMAANYQGALEVLQ